MSTKIAAGRLEGAHQRRSTSVGKPPPSAGSAFPLPTPSDLVTAEPGDMHESEMQQQAPSALAMATHALEEVAAGGANAAAQLAQQQQQQQQQQAPGGTQPHRTKFHALSFHHSHFAKAQDRDTSSLTAIKHAILPPPLLPDQVITPAQIDAVRARHPHVCEKVATRTVQMIVTRNAKNVATEKTRRLGLVMVTGFNASTREPYRPLGAPVLQVEDLVSGALSVPVKRQGIDSKSGRESRKSTPQSLSGRVTPTGAGADGTGGVGGMAGTDGGGDVSPSESASPSRKSSGHYKHGTDGSDLLKVKVGLSKSRLQAVRFGIPISHTLNDPQKQAEYEREQERLAREAHTGTYLDWKPSRIDRDKMHYFLRMMHEAQENEFRFLPAVVPYTRGVCPQQQQQHHRGGSDNGMVELLETTAPPTGPAGRRSPARDGGAMGRRTTTPSATSPDRRRSSTATGGGRTSALDPRSMTIDELELALGMQQVRHSDPASMVSTIHGEFLQDQGKLHDGLEEELDRFERQRKTVISHKYKAFSIGVNGICSTDLEHMRSAAATHRLQERNKTLRLHPWYNELLRIVFGSTSPSSNTPGGLETPGGAPVPFPTTTTTQGSPGRNGGTPRKAICEAERILLVRVRSLLGDNVPIDKVEFIRMLKLVPRAEFMTDSVQKVVKFLRQRMGISELEYLDAIELSGHMMSAIPGSAQGRSSVGSTGGAGGGGDADESDAGMDADDGGAHAAAEAELMAGVDSAMGMTGPGAGTISLIRGASRGNGGGYGGAGGGGGFGGTSPDRKRTLSLAPVGSGHRGGRKS